MIGVGAELLGTPSLPWHVLQTSNLAPRMTWASAAFPGVGSAGFSMACSGAAGAASTTRAPKTVGLCLILMASASCAISAACFLRPINSPCPRRDEGGARDQVGTPFLERFFCGHARVCGQPAGLAPQGNNAHAHDRTFGEQAIESHLGVRQHAGLRLEIWILDGECFGFRIMEVEGFANLVFLPHRARQCEGDPFVAEDHDSRRGLVRREEVVCKIERRSLVHVVDVENLPMAAFELSRPVRAVRLSRLGTRGARKAEQAERRHGGDTAKKAAPR